MPHPRSPALAPERALLHPLWLSALALMALNDHVWKAGAALPSVVTGKLSDVTGLFVAPAVVAAVLHVRSRRGLLAAHAAVGLWFAAMNLSDPFAAAWARLTQLSPFAPWHPVVDAPDLLALPMLVVAWRVLVPAMAQDPVAGLRLRWRTALQVAALGVGATFLLANEPAPTVTAIGPAEFSYTARLAIGNDTQQARIVRVRPLKSGVTLDCDTVVKKPGVYLSRRLFAPAVSWRVDPGRTVDFAREAPSASSACPAYLVDGPGLPMTLIFWANAAYAPTSLSSRVTPDRSRVVVISQQATGLTWLAHAAAFAPPPSLDPGPLPGCALPGDATSVAWSLPLPPAQALHTLIGIAEAPDGCLGLDLQHDTGSRRWYLCVPPGAFPFDVGDKVSVAPVEKDQGFGKLDGVAVTDGKGRAITAGRGGHVLYLGGAKATLAATKGCDGTFDACGAFATRLGLQVDGADLLPGQATVISKGRTLHLVRAQLHVTADAACMAGFATTGAGSYVESVLVEEP